MGLTFCGNYKLLTLIVLMQFLQIGYAAAVGNDSGVECRSIDVRNTVKRFKNLEDCRVIKGDLSIVLMERTTEKDFQNVTFPKLREITGFLLIFRVFGLKSVGALFPNLVVIRGHNLLTNYALIIYENVDLHEIGLKSLIAIQRGSVRIGNSPSLCYASTIDWAKITGGDPGYIVTSKTLQCPTTKSCRGCVPANCWSSKACQRSDTGYNFAATIKCHDQCLGGCTNRTARGCTVCRNVVDDGMCVATCKEPKVLHANSYRCITKDECHEMQWIVFDGQCISQCPSSYRLKNSFDQSYNMSARPVCILCESKCPKICAGREVTFLSDTDMFRGCSIINGSLQIRFIEDVHNIMQELEKNLGDIEEVYGILKVYRSVTLSSLNFFRSLHTIHGQGHGHMIDTKNYSMIVYENHNLQTLWDYRAKQQIVVKNGNLLFAANSKLCLHEIQHLQSIVVYNKTCGKECDFISPNTNGYMASCIMEPMFSDFNVTSHENVTIWWKPYVASGQQIVAGYSIFYIEAPATNITSYYGQDSCSSYSWRSDFVALEDVKTYKDMYAYEITNLTQFTQYAYYVRTSIIQSDGGINGQSEVRYFKTLASKPSPPKSVFTLDKTSNSISIGWTIQPEEKEIVDHITVDVLIQPNVTSWYDQRDYCQYPTSGDPVRRFVNFNSDDCCCDTDRDDMTGDDNSTMIFQLQSTGGTEVNCELEGWQSPECSTLEYRLKRSAHTSDVPISVGGGTLPEKMKFNNFYDAIEHLAWNPPDQRHTVMNPSRSRREIEQYQYYLGSYVVQNAHNFTLHSLLPYTTYIFQIFAVGTSNLTSAYYLYHEHTKAAIEADNVRMNILSVNHGSVDLFITAPTYPNGDVLSFIVEYKKLDENNTRIISACVPRKTHAKNMFVHKIDHLLTGVYEVRVCAQSLAGKGVYTEWTPFWIVNSKPSHATRDGWISFGIVALVVGVVVGAYFWRKRYRQRMAHHDDKVILLD